MTSDFFKGFLTYPPTHVRFFPNEWVLFYLEVSDFGEPTHLPKNRTSYVDDPLVVNPLIEIPSVSPGSYCNVST